MPYSKQLESTTASSIKSLVEEYKNLPAYLALNKRKQSTCEKAHAGLRRESGSFYFLFCTCERVNTDNKKRVCAYLIIRVYRNNETRINAILESWM